MPAAFLMLMNWIYMRLIVFPACLLKNVYDNQPTEKDSWNIVYNAYMYLLVMAFVLFGMHIYWTFYMIKSVYKSITSRDVLNEHEKLVKEK
ncbi:MAG: TLC domain-containing protein [Actinobacteria bacterium]|nr:TLC domain-containing protein [Actinomycetota bacterium]